MREPGFCDRAAERCIVTRAPGYGTLSIIRASSARV
jgi:hypothetical protein